METMDENFNKAYKPHIDGEGDQYRLTIPKVRVETINEIINKAYEVNGDEDEYAEVEGDTIKTLPNMKQQAQTNNYFVPLQRLSAQITGFTLRKIYASTVAIPAVYTEHKHEQYWTPKNFSRKVAGIPFALFYGFLLVWIVSDVIIGKQKVTDVSYSLPHLDVAINICKSIFTPKHPDLRNDTFSLTRTRSQLIGYLYNNQTVDAPVRQLKLVNTTFTFQYGNYNRTPHYWNRSTGIQQSTSNSSAEKWSRVFFENDSPNLYAITASVMTVIGLSSVFSRNIRATMLLILPGLITRHSRNLIFTIVLGILVHEGPVDNFRANFNKVIQNAACMYRTVVVMGCAEQELFKKGMKEARIVYKSLLRADKIVQEAKCRINPNNCFKTEYPEIPQPNIVQMLAKLVNPTTNSIKDQGKVVIEHIEKLCYYADIGRKVLTVLSILMLIVDAVRYLRNYYTDSSFDNMYVGQTVRKQWKDSHYYNKSEEYQQYTPSVWNEKEGLRRWEHKEGFSNSNLPKFTRRELWKVVRRSLATLMFSAFVLLALSADYLLASGLQYVKDNFNFTVSLGDVGRNLTKRFRLHTEDVEYTTSSCLLAPTYTNTSVYWIISLFLIAALASCFFEVYMSRIRAKLCNVFYPDRAEERADFLYFKIISGRINRRINLLLHLRREEERRRRLIRFSPWQRLKELFRRVNRFQSRSFACSGCGWRVPSNKEKYWRQISFVVDEKRQTTKVCKNCYLDVSDNDIHQTDLESSVAVVNEQEGCF